MSDKLTQVYTTSDAVEAEILKSALDAEGIQCMIDGESQAGFTGVGALEIKLLVSSTDAMKARSYIEEHARGEQGDREG